MKTTKISVAVAAAALAGGLLAPATAVAADRKEIRTGTCSGLSDWKLQVSPENGRLEVEFEVDANRRGQRWHVALFHGGRRVYTGTHRTRGISGSFTVRSLERNTADDDSFFGRAVRLSNGERCRGRIRF